jgi:hypothetical protein
MQIQHVQSNGQNQTQDILFDRKVDLATAGIQQYYNKSLRSLSKENTLVVCDYIDAMKIEINLSSSYRKLTIRLLTQLSRFHENKPFNLMARIIF